MTYDPPGLTLAAELRQTAFDPVVEPLQPLHMSDAQLLAQYEVIARQQPSIALATRIAMLRRRIQET
jgi:hypothetical protein